MRIRRSIASFVFGLVVGLLALVCFGGCTSAINPGQPQTPRETYAAVQDGFNEALQLLSEGAGQSLYTDAEKKEIVRVVVQIDKLFDVYDVLTKSGKEAGDVLVQIRAALNVLEPYLVKAEKVKASADGSSNPRYRGSDPGHPGSVRAVAEAGEARGHRGVGSVHQRADEDPQVAGGVTRSLRRDPARGTDAPGSHRSDRDRPGVGLTCLTR